MFVLYHKLTGDNKFSSNYYFDNINSIIDFLNSQKNKHGLPWQQVVSIDINTNVRSAILIDGYKEPCNSFNINKQGEMYPLNIHLNI